MRKINYLKLTCIFVAVLVSFYTFLSTRYEYAVVNGLVVPFALAFAIPIFMSYEYNNIKNPKWRTINTIIMVIFYVLDAIFLSMLIVQIFGTSAYFIDETGLKIPSSSGIFQDFQEFNVFFLPLLFMTASWLMLFINFSEIDKVEGKTNNYLTIIVCLVILLIHLNFYVNPNLRLEMNLNGVGERVPYITQNYIYFSIMYGVIIVKKFLNKGNLVKN